MPGLFDFVDKVFSLPIGWLARVVEKRNENKRAKLLRQHELLKTILGSVHAEAMGRIENTLREEDERERQ